jgi:hypothetical protein
MLLRAIRMYLFERHLPMSKKTTKRTSVRQNFIVGLNPALDEHPVRTIIKRENCISSISGELDINVATIKPKASYMLSSRTKLYLDTNNCRFRPANSHTSVFDK